MLPPVERRVCRWPILTAILAVVGCSLPDVTFDGLDDGGAAGLSGGAGASGKGGAAGAAGTSGSSGTGGSSGMGGSAGAAGCGTVDAYRQAVLADGPVAYWRLDEISGSTAKDSSGNGLDLNIEQGVVVGETGALACDSDVAMGFANADVGHLAALTDPAFEPKNALSFEFWMLQSGSVINNEKPLWYGDAYFSPWGAWGFGRVMDEPTFDFHVNLAGAAAGVHTAALVLQNTWYYVAATYDGTTLRVYVDGVLDAQASPPEILGGPITYGNDKGIAVGGCYGAGCSTFNGKIDEVAIYDKVLSTDRIAAHYAAGRP